ncbi:hypothetical protein PoB_004265600 [Plakobranchus ocellatus]|uniref:Uncharacterized protein n=1 Tax=Plakobranchus ocellatus TaxID=259542 RepID=A0AAV4AYH3_9GAST|nr:hypothetical protein PoB_004265600 [Plakobranchus ocellatus]
METGSGSRSKRRKTPSKNRLFSPKPGSVMSYRVSVESYFLKGMRSAEEQQGKVLSTEVTPLLGDMLNLQLSHVQMVNQATQTDWKWVIMAKRWRHARLLQPSVPRPACCKLERAPSAREEKISANYLSFSLEPAGQKEPFTYKREPSNITFVMTDSSDANIQRPKCASNHGRGYLKRLSQRMPESASNKCVDTSDLDFDPFDPFMEYTPVPLPEESESNSSNEEMLA